MLQSVNKLSTEPATHLCGPLDKNAAMKSANTTAIQKMILPHIPESNHVANPAARVRPIARRSIIALTLSQIDSPQCPSTFHISAKTTISSIARAKCSIDEAITLA
jgi:hypothetical protein